MPEVPLTYPTTAPTESGAAPLNVNAPVEAFGGQVGVALSHLGQSVQSDSDRIWERAVQLKDLQNRAEVDNADTQFMLEAGKIHAKFTSLGGMDAGPEALQAHIKQLDDARRKIGSGLSNSVTQRLYDTQSLGTFGRTIFNMAGHAGTQVRTAQLDALKTHGDTSASRAGAADNERDMNIYADQAETDLRRLYGSGNLGRPEEADDQVFNMRSAIYAQYAKGLIEHGKLPEADEFRKRHADDLGDKDKREIDRAYESNLDIIGTDIAAKDIIAKGYKDSDEQKYTRAQVRDMAIKRAQKEQPGNDRYERAMIRATEHEYDDDQRAQRDLTVRSEQTLWDLFATGKANSWREMLADPDGGNAYNNLRGKARTQVALEFTKKFDDAHYNTLSGMINGEDINQQNAMLAISPAEMLKDGQYEVSPGQYKQLMADRRRVINRGPQENSLVKHAMQVLRASHPSAMRDLNVDKPGTSPEDYNHFIGTLWGIIQERMGEDKKAPTDKEIVNDIWPLLTKSTMAKGFWFGQPYQLNKMIEPDPDWVNEMNKEARAQGQPDLDEDAQRRAWGQYMARKYPAGGKSSDRL